MLRRVCFVLFSLTLSFLIAGCKEDEEEPIDTTQHDNWVYFTPDWGNPPLSFSLSEHSITSGQPWGGVTASTQNSDWGLDAKAGRHASGSVASWFHSHASIAICANFPSGCGSWPSELNFAFTGTITIDGKGYAITIGQGSTGIHNNWWVGGNGWTYWSSPFGEAIVTPDGKYYFEATDDTFNEFDIREKP